MMTVNMKISALTGLERSWAIPAISALIVLHHDFPLPRLAQIRRIAWSDTGLEVTLQYGTRNISGKIIQATDFLITLHRNGAVGIQLANALADNQQVTMLGFLAGEIVRETWRWSQDVTAWIETSAGLPAERAAVLNIVGALVAYPADHVDIAVEKETNDRTHVSKVRILGDTAMMELTSAGIRCANVYVQPLTKHSMTVRSYTKYVIPKANRRRKSLPV